LWEELRSQGYTRLSAETQLRLLAHLSRWLDEEGISPEELTPEVGQRFLEARRAAGYVTFVSSRSLAVPVAYLRRRGVSPEPVLVPVRPEVDALLERYSTYLVDERGLAAGTVNYYLELARLFLAERAHPLLDDLNQLTAAQVNDFVVCGCAERSVDSAKRLASSMRSLLRFLFAKGLLSAELASASPPWLGGARRFLRSSIRAGWPGCSRAATGPRWSAAGTTPSCWCWPASG